MSRKQKDRPAIAGAALDAECGSERNPSDQDVDKALYALTVMRERGLISADEFERRRAALKRSKG